MSWIFQKLLNTSKPPVGSNFTLDTKLDIRKTGSRLAPINKASDPPYDTMAFLVFCSKHERIAVCNTEYNRGQTAVWLPFIQQNKSKSWADDVREYLPLILSDNEPKYQNQLKTKWPFETCYLQILRTQLTQTQEYITRVIVLARFERHEPLLLCCQKTSRIDWISLEKAKINDIKNVWGPEIYTFGCSKLDVDGEYPLCQEYCLDDVYEYLPRDPPRTDEESMLKDMSLNESYIERVYSDFILHCFPSFVMSFDSFKDYLYKYGFERQPDDRKLQSLFNAFSYEKTGSLTFHELFIGLASLEPNCPNVWTRIKFVFRYYDTNNDGFLSETELRSMIKDMNEKKSDGFVDKKTGELIKQMGTKKDGISYDNFEDMILSMKFRGTGQLCRCKQSLFRTITNAMSMRGIKAYPEIKRLIVENIEQNKYTTTCNVCTETKYRINPMSVSINKTRQLSDTISLEKFLTTNPLKGIDRYLRDVTFNMKSFANQLRQQIRDFNPNKGTKDRPKGLFQKDPQKMNETIDLMLKQMIPILESEKRCLKIRSPAVVIGDIHGNLEDLLSIEKYLFPSVPLVDKQYLFLGDYVDRGKWSIECALYVFCLKILVPNSFFILRGNHETRVLQDKYTFTLELKNKYPLIWRKVFDNINEIFDRLPLAAVIDDSIFCVHGGIPFSAKTIDEINKINVKVSDLEKCKVGWELVWNDPLNDYVFNEVADNQKFVPKNGFIPNINRGTGQFFNEMAAFDFLKTNGLTHIIRAHEVVLEGYRFQFNGQLVTIFSCSHYCGTDNKAAVVQVDEQTLRVIQLDTSKNAPATDSERKVSKN